MQETYLTRDCDLVELQPSTCTTILMSQTKTPSRRRSRSTSISPIKPKQRPRSNSRKAAAGDTTNPFISKSRPVSPVKRTNGGFAPSESLSRQASGGVIRKGGVESRLDVVTRDYVPALKPEIKRSKSTSSVVSRTLLNSYFHV